jgi:transcriptional regulator with XRE-family HTH domain
MTTADLQVRLGEKIKTIRTEKKMTQNKLALQCDFEKASMSRLEAGRTNPTLRTLSKICTALDVPIEELFKN